MSGSESTHEDGDCRTDERIERHASCRGCDITLPVSELEPAMGSRNSYHFEWVCNHSWRCSNCGFEGAVDILHKMGSVRPAEFTLDREYTELFDSDVEPQEA